MEVLQCGLERGLAIEVHSRGELTYVNVGFTYRESQGKWRAS